MGLASIQNQFNAYHFYNYPKTFSLPSAYPTISESETRIEFATWSLFPQFFIVQNNLPSHTQTKHHSQSPPPKTTPRNRNSNPPPCYTSKHPQPHPPEQYLLNP